MVLEVSHVQPCKINQKLHFIFVLITNIFLNIRQDNDPGKANSVYSSSFPFQEIFGVEESYIGIYIYKYSFICLFHSMNTEI